MMSNPVGVLLAGGQSRRMGGGDKCLKMLGGASLLERAIARARSQVSELILNANGDSLRFKEYDLPVVPDVLSGFYGPLAGILTGMEWAKAHVPEARWIVTFATDAPFFPINMASVMMTALQNKEAQIACAESGGKAHPVFGVWPVNLASDLRTALVDEGLRKIDKWTSRYQLASVKFSKEGIDPFLNLNQPEDFTKARKLLAGEALLSKVKL